MQVAILLFPGAAADDVTGHCAVMARLSGAELCFVAEEPGMVASDDDAVPLVATRALSEVTAPDVLFVPGGPGVKQALEQHDVLRWIHAADRASRWTLAVRSGARLLAAAGVLDDELTAVEDVGTGGPARPPGAEGEPPRRVPVPIVLEGRMIAAHGPLPMHDVAMALAAHIMGAEIALLTRSARSHDVSGPLPFIPDDPSGLCLVPPAWDS